MKVLNPSRFQVEVDDILSYNSKTVEWINKDRKSRGKDLWPSAEELNIRNPKVVGFDLFKHFGSRKRYMQILVGHDNGYTGFSGVIDKQRAADIWFLNADGTFLDSCPYPLFIKRKNEDIK